MGMKILNPGVSVSKLFCDKFTFTVDYIQPAQRNHIKSIIKELSSYKGMFGGKSSKAHYKYGVFVYPDENPLSEPLLILAEPKKADKSYLRVSFNPARINLIDCWSVINALLPGNMDDLIMKGRCTRFDATVDITGLTPSELLAYYPGMQISRSFRKGGKCQTLDMGRYDGDKRIVVYDKVAKEKSWNEKHAIKQPVPVKPTTRIEIVMKPGLMYGAMTTIKNPFVGLTITPIPPVIDVQSELFRMFVAAAQAHGAHDMLNVLDYGTKKQFKEILSKAAFPWWQPEKLWSQWPSLLQSTFSVGHPFKELAA